MKKSTLALDFVNKENISLSNCILRLNNNDDVLAVQCMSNYIFYLFIDGSAVRTNKMGSEIIIWGDDK